MDQLKTHYILEWIRKNFSLLINIVSAVIGGVIILLTTRGQRSALSECHSSNRT